MINLTNQLQRERERRDEDRKYYHSKIESLDNKVDETRRINIEELDMHINLNGNLMELLDKYESLLEDYVKHKFTVSSIKYPEGHVVYSKNNKGLKQYNQSNCKIKMDDYITREDYKTTNDARIIAAYDPNRYFAHDNKYIGLYYKFDDVEWIVAINKDEELKKELEGNEEDVKIILRDIHSLVFYYMYLLLEVEKGKVRIRKGVEDGS
ncbi:hypothetical protein [Aquibacillus albus]|uniref:Uncharacterized protein n=1 Tax=Aquibacillus albus TaxID=1168171 RepID=A0ABS2N3L0_9BACI|nr:hypothetical protein [Aquibacillus albus]MBM7572686.1 hypothetical protein [Aquibacillus albus]